MQWKKNHFTSAAMHASYLRPASLSLYISEIDNSVLVHQGSENMRELYLELIQELANVLFEGVHMYNSFKVLEKGRLKLKHLFYSR